MSTSIPSTLTLVNTKIAKPSTSFSNKSNIQASGRFVQGGNVVDLGNRLGWWERTKFPADVSDISLEIGMRYNMRPDLLAYDLYGKSTLGWFVLQYNYISDVTDFVTGLQLIVPTKSRLFRQILTNSGRNVNQ
jgi:hypothetical protein